MIPSTAVIDRDTMMTLSRNFRVGNFIEITFLTGSFSHSHRKDRRAAAPCGIRLRAERKAGDLLRDREKAKGTRGQLSGGRIQLPLETASAISASRNKPAKCPPRFAGFMSGARGGLRRHKYSRA